MACWDEGLEVGGVVMGKEGKEKELSKVEDEHEIDGTSPSSSECPVIFRDPADLPLSTSIISDSSSTSSDKSSFPSSAVFLLLSVIPLARTTLSADAEDRVLFEEVDVFRFLLRDFLLSLFRSGRGMPSAACQRIME